MPGWHISSGGGGGGGGDVVGPAGATDNDLVAFDGATGKLLKDTGILYTDVVVGPATATDNAFARYDGATGKLIQNGVLTSADFNGDLTGPTTNTATSGFGTAFTNQPTNDGVTIVSDNAADTTQTVTIIGNTNGGDVITTEDIALNGIVPVNSVKVDWGQVVAVKLSAACAGTVTISETSGGLAITTIAAAATDAGVFATSTSAFNRIVNYSSNGATTKHVGIQGTNSAGATIYEGKTLTGTTLAAGATSFVTVTELYIGDLENNRSLTVTVTGGTKLNSNYIVTGPTTAVTDNAIPRFDGTRSDLIQDSALTISDVAAGVVTLATTAGNALAVKNTDPVATTGASVAGDPLTITAGNAVASTDTAGAAAGGDLTITSGNAARNTSGSAAGGEILLKTGDGIGGGAQGKVRIPSIVQIEHPLSIWGQQLASQSGQVWILNQAGNDWQGIGAKYFHLGDGQVTFSSSTNPDSGDVGIERLGVGVIAPTNASSGVGWINNQGGYAALASDYTNATATPTNITALTTTLLAGRKYTFRMVLFFSDSQAAEGALFDFDGGTATATDFRAHAVIYDSALLLSSQSSALATDFAVATATGASMIEVNGSLTVNAAGTFIPRAAQNSHTSGTLTVETGSHLWVEDTTFN